MFCPNCAKENSIEQKFCRSCGFNLERTIDHYLEQAPNYNEIPKAKIDRFFENIGKVGFGGLIGAGLVGILLLLLTLINKFILSGQIEKIAFGLVLFVLILSAVFGLAYVIFQEYQKQTKKKASSGLINELESKETIKLIEEKPFEAIPSVTEKTTNLLFVEVKPKTSGELN